MSRKSVHQAIATRSTDRTPHLQFQECLTSCTASLTATTRSACRSPYRRLPPTKRPHNRSKYRFGKTLGAGTYGIVREADCPEGKVAVKIILKKNVKGNEQMVYDELEMLQRLKHPHIVRFHDWFESRVCWNCVSSRNCR